MLKDRKFLIIITVINLAILILVSVILVRISWTNQKINSVGNEFFYTDTESDEVSLDLGDRGNVLIRFAEDGVIIKDSYVYDDRESILKILCFVRCYSAQKGYEIKRTNTELIGEYRLHTILYSVGYKSEQTGTLNWDFTEDPRWYVNIVSAALGWCGV